MILAASHARLDFDPAEVLPHGAIVTIFATVVLVLFAEPRAIVELLEPPLVRLHEQVGTVAFGRALAAAPRALRRTFAFAQAPGLRSLPHHWRALALAFGV